MKCDKCGEMIEPGDLFCTNCGTSVKVQQPTVPQQLPNYQVVIPQQQLPNYQVVVQQPQIAADDKKNANILCIISLILYFAAPIFALLMAIVFSLISEDASMLSTGITSISRIAAYVLMIVARIKYPESTFAKILMWIYIGLFAVGFIMGILLIILLIIGIFSFVEAFG